MRGPIKVTVEVAGEHRIIIPLLTSESLDNFIARVGDAIIYLVTGDDE